MTHFDLAKTGTVIRYSVVARKRERVLLENVGNAGNPIYCLSLFHPTHTKSNEGDDKPS